MKHSIESLVNTITMYKLTVFGLLAITAVALLLSTIGVLGQPIIGLLLSLTFIVTVSYASSRLFAWTFSTKHNSESWLITALILFLIISPPDEFTLKLGTYWAELLLTGLAAFFATASKYILAVRGKHVFNPAAIGVVAVSLFGLSSGYATWWVATPFLLPVVVIAGLLIVVKTRRYVMVNAFLAAALSVIVVVALLTDYPVIDALKLDILSGPLLFFAAIMLTEPLTSPATKKWQIVYAILVGVLFSSQLPWVSSPEVALLIGNVLAFAVGLHYAPTLHIHKIIKLSPTTYEILAAPSRPLLFKPGQYLELSLPHRQQDLKGMRRVFSIASAPSEKFVRFGITVAGEISSFKKELLKSEGKIIRAVQLGGDFTLPTDTTKPLLFIAGGVGITPFRSMLSDMLEISQKRDVTLFYGAATVDAIMYQDILDKAEQKAGLNVIPVVAEPRKNWQGESGFVRVSLLHRYVPDFRDRLIYISGPPAMVETIKKQLQEKGVDKRHIKTDYFTGY